MERLKLLRKELKKTQTDIANVLGITVSAYGNYELGQREPDNANLIKLAKYFGVSTDYLLGLSEERTASTTPSLSYNEQELLSLFNKLSPEDKQRAIGYLTCLCNS